MKIGYARVSTQEQNEERQLRALYQDQQVDRLYLDKQSGKDAQRPELQAMLQIIRAGDTVIVESISRLARNTKDLLTIVDTITEQGGALISLKEAIDTNTASGKFMLTVFGAMAELERAYILDRQREGIAIAKENGAYKGRKPTSIDMEYMRVCCRRWRAGEITAIEAMRKLNLKPNTFYRRVKEYDL